MDLQTFFNLILHDEGYYSILGLTPGPSAKPRQYLVPTLDRVTEIIDDLLAQQKNVYFACAKYASDANRKATNVSKIKAFRLDIDCARPGKPYATQRAGFEALKAFVKNSGLPRPMLVSSGMGLHVYWPLDEAIDRAEWLPLAKALKRATEAHGLLADPDITADATRVLRVPGTLNFKDSPPTKVAILNSGAHHICTVANFREALSRHIVDEPIFENRPKRVLDPVTQALMGNKVANFREILTRSLLGKGCAHLAHTYKNQESIQYDQWRAALSIAANCEDSAKAIHKISEKHPNYSFSETENKAEDLYDKPYKCETFYSIQSDLCKGCKWSGKIKSPIQIYQRVLEAEAVQEIEEAKAREKEVTPETPTLDSDDPLYLPPPPEPEAVKRPEYPYPYVRGQNGGVYRKGAKLPDGSQDSDVLICMYDIYALRRLYDPDLGECAEVRVETPHDGVRAFLLPYTYLVASDKLSGILAKVGLVYTGKDLTNIQQYLKRSVEYMQNNKSAQVARNQFGWHDNDSTFVIGTREISANEVRYSPPSKSTAETASFYDRKGDVKEWIKITDLYNRPGNEVRAFCLFAGFGSALMKFTGKEGGLIHLESNDSGIGKTAVLEFVNSIWGHPRAALLLQQDTFLSRMNRPSVLGNVAMTVDELTNMKDHEVSDFTFVVSYGRDRHRMQSQVNEIRSNPLRWALICLTTGNKSLVDVLRSRKENPEGELMRMLEFHIEKADDMTKAESDALLAPMYENYGVAGEVFIRYVIRHMDEVKQIMRDVQAKVDHEFGFEQRERYWSAIITSALAAGLIAKKIGLHNIDVSRVKKWLGKTIFENMRFILSGKVGPSVCIGQYMSENWANCLSISSSTDSRKDLLPIIYKEPRNGVMFRYEPDTKLLFIPVKEFRAWCSKNQISYKARTDEMAKSGILIEIGKKRLLKGTGMSSPGVQVLQIDGTKLEGLDHEELAKNEIRNSDA